MGFGRKGLDGQAPMAAPSTMGRMPPGMARAMNQPGSGEPAVSSQLQAFLAAERANRGSAPEPEITDVAERMRAGPVRTGSKREMWVAYLLWWFLGGFAAHRFYLGQATSAVIMIATMIGSFAMMAIIPPVGLGCFVLWALWLLADIALIPGMTRRYNDALSPAADVFA